MDWEDSSMRRHYLVLIRFFEPFQELTECLEVKAMASTRRDCRDSVQG